MMEDLYKNCRWCRWFEKGKCLNQQALKSSSVDIQYYSEQAIVSEAIEEGFFDAPFPELRSNLESKLSKKKADEIMKAFYEELEAIKIEWVVSIDESVSSSLNNAINREGKSGVEIVDPEEFHCRYFM
jgi:hypothetical protein